jgi:hypothetical protein
LFEGVFHGLYEKVAATVVGGKRHVEVVREALRDSREAIDCA